MYHIHRTVGYVVRLYPRGEADMVVTLCTRDYGVVNAIAKGLRKEVSKLRYVVQELSCVYVELVRGKEVWRITSVQPIIQSDPIYIRPLVDTQDKRSIARIADLLRRLGGEESLPQAFGDIRETHQLLLEGTNDRLVLESVAVARLLAYLGYVDMRHHEVLHIGPITKFVLEYAREHQQEVLQTINTALSASQL